jgi:hypothetical protein
MGRRVDGGRQPYAASHAIRPSIRLLTQVDEWFRYPRKRPRWFVALSGAEAKSHPPVHRLCHQLGNYKKENLGPDKSGNSGTDLCEARGRGRPGCLHSERRVGSNETDSRSWEYRSVSSCDEREGGSERAPFCASVECMQAYRRGWEESGILFTMLFAFGGSMVHNVAESITGSGGLSPVRYQKREGST